MLKKPACKIHYLYSGTVGLRHRALRPSVGKDSDARAGAAGVRLRGGRRQGGRGQGNQRSRQGMCPKVGAVLHAQNGVKLFYVSRFFRICNTICSDDQMSGHCKTEKVLSREKTWPVDISQEPKLYADLQSVAEVNVNGLPLATYMSRDGNPESGETSRCRNPMVRRMRILSTVARIPPVSDIFGQL